MQINSIASANSYSNKSFNNQPSFKGKLRFSPDKDAFFRISEKLILDSHSDVSLEEFANKFIKFLETLGNKTKAILPEHINAIVDLREKEPKVYVLTNKIVSDNNPKNHLQQMEVEMDLKDGSNSDNIRKKLEELSRYDFNPEVIESKMGIAIAADKRASEKVDQLRTTLG